MTIDEFEEAVAEFNAKHPPVPWNAILPPSLLRRLAIYQAFSGAWSMYGKKLGYV